MVKADIENTQDSNAIGVVVQSLCSSAFKPGSLLGDLSDFALHELKNGKRNTAEEAVRWAGRILCAREERFDFRKVLRDVKRRMNKEISNKA
jgi:hypothetical protein